MRPHRPAAPIGGSAWFSERLPFACAVIVREEWPSMSWTILIPTPAAKLAESNVPTMSE